MIAKKRTSAPAGKKETLKDIIDAVAAKEKVLHPLPKEKKNPGIEEFESIETSQSRKADEQMVRLSNLLERAKIAEYVRMSERPIRLLFLNFLIGLARGFGFLIGASVMVAFFLYLLGKLVQLPYIGEYFGAIFSFFRAAISAKF